MSLLLLALVLAPAGSGDRIASAWSELPVDTADMAVAWAGGQAYIFGGFADGGSSDRVFVFDPATSKLTELTSLPYGLWDAGVAYDDVKNHIYLFGGHNSDVGRSDDILRFDVATETIEILPQSLRTAVQGPAAVWIDGAAYIIGGLISGGDIDDVQKFTPGSPFVSFFTNMPVDVYNARAVVDPSDDVAYVFHYDDVYKLDPNTFPRASTMSAIMPVIQYSYGAVWDGSDVLLLGGRDTGPAATTHVYRYNVGSDSFTSVGSLAEAVWDHGAVWDGSNVILIGGRDDTGRISHITAYDPIADASEELPLPSGVAYASAVWTGTDALLLGGVSDRSSTTLNDITRFNPSTSTTTVINTMPTELKETSAALDSGTVYLFGGRDDSNSRTAAVTPFDATTGNVLSTTTPSLPSARYGTSATIDPDARQVYIVGGRDSGTLDDILVYDIGANTLTTVASMPQPRMFTASVWTGDELLIFGGGPYDILRYDPVANVVQETGVMLPNDEISAIWDGDNAFIFAGDFLGPISKIYKYDPIANELTAMATQLPSPRKATASVWTGEEALIIGGYDGDDQMNAVIQYDLTPAPPEDLVARPSGIEGVRLDWNAPPANTYSAISHYNVYRGTAAGGLYSLIGSTVGPEPTYHDGSATGGTRYYYRVSAVNQNVHEGDRSSEDWAYASASLLAVEGLSPRDATNGVVANVPPGIGPFLNVTTYDSGTNYCIDVEAHGVPNTNLGCINRDPLPAHFLLPRGRNELPGDHVEGLPTTNVSIYVAYAWSEDHLYDVVDLLSGTVTVRAPFDPDAANTTWYRDNIAEVPVLVTIVVHYDDDIGGGARTEEFPGLGQVVAANNANAANYAPPPVPLCSSAPPLPGNTVNWCIQ